MTAPSNDSFNRLEDLLSDIDNELNISDDQKEQPAPTSLKESLVSESHKAIPLFENLFLYINELETQAILKYFPRPSAPPLSLKALTLLEKIKQQGITYGLIEKNIQKLVQLMPDKPDAEIEVIAAVGREPTEGRPAIIDYWIGNEESCKKTGIILARKNDLLLRLTPAKPGIPGMRITGQEIIPAAVKKVDVIAGDHVRKTKQREYYADCAGTVVLKDHVLTVHEINRDAHASVTVSDDKMQAFLVIEPPMGKGKPVTHETIQKCLYEAGVRHGIQKQAIDHALIQSNQNKQPVQNVVIAEGTPPVAGRDGSITWHIHPKKQRDRFVIEEDGSVNFYNQDNIITVTEGNHLLTILQATEGRHGTTVNGDPIPAEKGKPVRLVAGPNIETQNDGTEWYAACTGLYRLHHNILEVQPMYYVKGDVDFSVGNIDFNGDVIIAGNVLDGFEVRAKGAIIVKGTVEAAILESEKCVEVTGGIFGKEKGRIIAANNIVSCFLQNAEVRSGNDVIIGNQILNSRVFARNNVEVRSGKGSLVGGITFAGHSIKAKIIGSDYGTKTELDVGSDFMILEKMSYINQKMKSLRAKADLLDNIISQELDSYDDLQSSDERERLLSSARQRQKALHQAIANLRSEYKALSLKLHTTDHPFIIASDTIMPDVYVRLREERYKFRTPNKRVKIGLDPDTCKIVISSKQ